jgi:hypothetical protein
MRSKIRILIKEAKVDWSRWDNYLGTMPDAELARRVGCNRRAVLNRRKALEIEPYEEPSVINWDRLEPYLIANERGEASLDDLVPIIGVKRKEIINQMEKRGMQPWLGKGTVGLKENDDSFEEPIKKIKVRII